MVSGKWGGEVTVDSRQCQLGGEWNVARGEGRGKAFGKGVAKSRGMAATGETVQYDHGALAQAAGELGLRLVALHGSRAEGRAEVGSDIDLAVLAEGKVDGARRMEVYRRLSEVIRGASLDISLLNGAQPNFLAVVADTGRALYEVAPGEFLRFRSLAGRVFADAEKWQQAQWEHLGGGSTIEGT